MKIKIGYVLAKPVETQAQCDAYTAMVEEVNSQLIMISKDSITYPGQVPGRNGEKTIWKSVFF